MGIVALKLIPTVNAEYTPTLNESGISDCQFIRFMAGLPQKLGGWEKFYGDAVGGVPRALHAWSDLNSIDHLAIGSTTKLGVITEGVLQDITPQTYTSDIAPDFSTTATDSMVTIVDTNIANVTIFDSIFFNTPVSIGGLILRGVYPIELINGTTSYDIDAIISAPNTEANAGTVPAFTTVSGSAFVNVELADHGQIVGDRFTFPITTAVGGLDILGTYTVTDLVDADNFTISAASSATSSVSADMNGGLAQLVYYLTLGPVASGTGYGVGGYGVGGYGSGAVPSSQTGTPITATNWTLDNWGETLIACPQNGGIYAWTPRTGQINAGLIPTAPIFNGGIFIAMPEQILVAWGSVATGEQRDPLWINWSASLDYTNWVVSSVTQAGGFRIPEGSAIVGALQGQHQALIWTDVDMWVMQYLGPPLVYGFNKVASGCGLIGIHGACQMRGSVFWMSYNDFFTYGGSGIQAMPCTVWDKVFQDLDSTNAHKCVAAPNSSFDEVWFFYPSASGGTGEIDSYVKYNIEEQAWDFGPLDRTAWIDQSLLGQPIGASSAGIIYQHEMTNNADGQALVWWFETGYFVLSEGQDMMVGDWFWPDMRWGLYNSSPDATVIVTITAIDYPNATPRTYGPFTMTAATEFINCRMRGRQMKVKFEGNDLNSFVRLGKMRFRIAQDGRN